MLSPSSLRKNFRPFRKPGLRSKDSMTRPRQEPTLTPPAALDSSPLGSDPRKVKLADEVWKPNLQKSKPSKQLRNHMAGSHQGDHASWTAPKYMGSELILDSLKPQKAKTGPPSPSPFATSPSPTTPAVPSAAPRGWQPAEKKRNRTRTRLAVKM